ncbi:MAG: excisionase family DNA-binding protein, partial [Pontimonas sp.]
AVILDSLGKQITPHEAAELLRVPITHMVKLLDDGTLPFTRVGDFRRLSLDDVLTYRQLRDARRHEGLDELARLSQELGLYDLDYSTIKVKRLLEFEEDESQANSGENEELRD